jgi:hypothetical protein
MFIFLEPGKALTECKSPPPQPVVAEKGKSLQGVT